MQKFQPPPFSATQASAQEELYAIERHVENAEMHLQLAAEQLHQAKLAHGRAMDLQAAASHPEFCQRLERRLEASLKRMA